MVTVRAVMIPSLNGKASATIEIELWPAPLPLGCYRIRTPRCRICPQSFAAQVSMLQFVVSSVILTTQPIAPLFSFLLIAWQCSSCVASVIICLATDCASPGPGRHLTRHPFGCCRIHPQLWALRVPFGWSCPPSSSLGLPTPSHGGASSPCRPPPAGHSTVDVSLDLQPSVVAHVEEPTSIGAITPELQLGTAFEVLHRFDMDERNKSLSMEELDLIEFLVAQVASLSSSLAVDTVSPTLSPVACEVVDLQYTFGVSIAPPRPPLPIVVDAPANFIGSLTPPMVALVLQATSVREFFKAKPSDLAALEVGPKGVALVRSCRSARLAVKCRGGTIKLLVPCCLLPSKVLSRRRMAHPKSCSLRPLHGGTSSDLCFVPAAAPDRSGVSGGFLQSAWYKDVEDLRGHIVCYE
jgi:hypothetical protein